MIFVLLITMFCGAVSLLGRHDLFDIENINNPNSVCKKTYSVQTSHFVPYVETYRARSYITRIRTRINYKIENQVTWKTEDVCCEGYTQFQGTCIPVCQEECEFGFCYQPNVCQCFAGYTKLPSRGENICFPVCENECVQGFCGKPNNCTCFLGYKLQSDAFTCSPICDDACPETEICAEPNECRCIAGYKRPIPPTEESDRSSTLAVFQEKPRCEPVCDVTCVNGDCVAPNLCQCHEGYAKIEDEAFNCVPVCDDTCHFGNCTAPGVCSCDLGYKFSPGEKKNACEPVCSEPCVNGACVAPETCSCFESYTLLEDSKYDCKPMCNGSCENGACSEFGVCACNAGYEFHRSTHGCVFRCECANGFCTEPDPKCHCNEGFSLISDKSCAPKCDQGCINGSCTAPQICECPKDHVLANDTRGGNKCINPCETCANGVCSAREKCQCFHGWKGDDCDEPFLCMVGFGEENDGDFIDRIANFTTIHNLGDYKLQIPQNYFPECSPECAREIENITACFSSNENRSNVTCFLSIELECNKMRTSAEEKYTIGKTPWIFGITLLILMIAVLALSLFIKKQKAAKKQNQFVAHRISAQQREAMDCLLEDEGNF